MKHYFLSFILIFQFYAEVKGQINYLNRGNEYLTEKNYKAAEQIFRDGMKSDSSNLIYPCQLALALMRQDLHAEAQNVLNRVLSKDSVNIGALWYAGTNTFLDSNADLRLAVFYFEKVIPLLNKNQGQYYSAHWFIGRAYQILLQRDGLNYNEVSRMLQCYETYTNLQPDADDAQEIKAFVMHIKKVRPSENVLKWINR